MLDADAKVASPSVKMQLLNSVFDLSGWKLSLNGGRSSRVIAEAASRLRALFAGHGLTNAEVLRVVPDAWDWSLADVTSDERLLTACRAEHIAWLADTFGVRRGWLEGDGNRIYDWPMGYKQPKVFAEMLRELGWLTPKLRVTILSAGYKTGANGSLGFFTIVFSYPLLEWENGERTFYRHLNYDAEMMDWDHEPCRLDAYALTGWRHRRVQSYGAVPIVPCSRAAVEAVADGTEFPGRSIPWGWGGFDRLEDRVVESPIAGKHRRIDLEAKEFEETCVAQQYAKLTGLMAICRQEAISE